jgi:enolase-phosphatase E1
VTPSLRRWRQGGLELAIYSSGSEQAQRLLLGHTTDGDLTPLFSHFFDTAIGSKKEAASYSRIAGRMQLQPGEILFLSDVEPELDAAAAAGLLAVQVMRPGTNPGSRYLSCTTFDDLRRTDLPFAGISGVTAPVRERRPAQP